MTAPENKKPSASLSVASVIIGNEVLSAKVRDLNGPYLVEQLSKRGIPVTGIFTVPDQVDAIVEAVLLAKRRASIVITSGGIGPTHDDVTVRAVSLALNRRVVRIPEMEALLTEAFQGHPSAAALRMAEGPQGSRLITSADTRFPVLACESIYMLPGVPQLFRVQCEMILAEWPAQTCCLKTLYLDANESDLAPGLDTVALGMPAVSIGSYPTWDAEENYRVKVTFEHSQAIQVEAAVARFRELLPPSCVVLREV
jgi:molybdenum cofactor synthesis domain-containing protein